jgi:undecaprenyl-diphosphatase
MPQAVTPPDLSSADLTASVVPPPERGADASRATLAAGAAIGIAIGALVGALVVSGIIHDFDERLSAAMSQREGALADPRYREALRDITALGSFSVLAAAVIAASGYLFASRRPRLALLLTVSALGATAFSTVLKLVIDRARPDAAEPGLRTFTASFPSGHALLSAAIILTIGGLIAFAARRRSESITVMVIAAVLTLVVGASRVALGVHWPSDVIAGWGLGLGWACLTLIVARVTTDSGRR